MRGSLKIILLAMCLQPVLLRRIYRNTRIMTDPISRTRCDLMCVDVSKTGRSQCRSECKIKEQKPGTCPANESPSWSEVCVEACNADYHCDGTERCCRHNCSTSCREPVDLMTIPGLPAVPVITGVKEKNRAIRVLWSDGVGDSARAVPGIVLYLLQERHHLGPKFEESRLGQWNFLLRTNKTRANLRDFVKPGRWYRFRVASVSTAGSRGFSRPSMPFTTRRAPRSPPAPRRLRAIPLKSDGPNKSVRLEWLEPQSDVPVLRYKVFWSRRAKGIQESELESVVVNTKSVPKNQTYYNIPDLQPNSMYFLQVQTISHFGITKLRSDKAAIFFNTSTEADTDCFTDITSEKPKSKKRKTVTGLKLKKVIWLNGKLKASVTWDPLPSRKGEPRRYNVRWVEVSCGKKRHISKKQLSAITEQTTFEIYELDYSCKYKVDVNRSGKLQKSKDSEIIVAVPDCKYFRRKMNGTGLNCDNV